MYKNIDEFPVYNWFKCIDLKDYSYCLRVRKECTESELIECQNTFSELYAQYIDTFGISTPLKDIIDLQNEILVLKIDKALTNDNTITSFIMLKELELADKLNVKQVKTTSTTVMIEKYMKFALDEKQVSVLKYYNYLEAIKEDNGRATD